MGDRVFSKSDYVRAREDCGVTRDRDVTINAEQRARETGKLSEIVDPGINPVRFSKPRLNAHKKKWVLGVGCPMDIEVTCDTTGSMGGEVDTEMRVLPKLYEAIAKYLPGYDPQLCLGIFGDVEDPFVMCRPQFEMEAAKIVNYLKEMAPQRDGGDWPEDPQYAMFARAYLTNAYTNNIGLKGYHFTVTDAICHNSVTKETIRRIFGNDIFETELKNMWRAPSLKRVISDLQGKTHQFVLVIKKSAPVAEFWKDLCGSNHVVNIRSTSQLPEVISAIIGLTEGTLEITDLDKIKGLDDLTIKHLSGIDIGAQMKLRHALPHPVPKAGDIFAKKGDLWPIQPGEAVDAEDEPEEASEADKIQYL